MKLSLSEVMNVPAGVQTKRVPLEADCFLRQGVTYPILEKEEVVLTLTNLGGRKVGIQAQSRVVLSVPCDRCLKECPVELPVFLDEEIVFDEDGRERIEDWNRTGYVDGYDLDVDRMVYEELLLGFPTKVLCKQDCKGICKICGADLNQGECGCDRTEPDPRMSVIRDIFNSVKEV